MARRILDRLALLLALAPVGFLLIEEADPAELEDPYADDPYWYQPGHPVEPASAANLRVASGFSVERVLDAPEGLGSWTTLCVDPQGRLIAAAQHKRGLVRITLPDLDDPGGTAKIERLGGAAADVGWAHGLLYAFGSLYVTVAEDNDVAEAGVYRLRDTDGDDQFDRSEQLFALAGVGEHGPHGLAIGPDGQSLYLMCGNGTPPVEGLDVRRPTETEGVDHLMPPGFESSNYTTGGWVLRFSPDGGDRELFCGGLRNSYDLAFNDRGDLFTFDSDMEWDLGAPWYRPTRICHLVSGGEFGWRADAAKWPEHYEDSVAPALNVGPGSPSGLTFGYGSDFPERYRGALFVCDWTFATIHAVFLREEGGSYRAEFEEFLGGEGLPLTDVVIGKDGAMYFTVGGRRLGSALYRVRYVGEEPTGAVAGPANLAQLHRERRELEALHSGVEAGDLAAIWRGIGSEDRATRFAARVALEKLPVDLWREKALGEEALDAKLTALLALARQGDEADLAAVMESWLHLPFEDLSVEKQLRALRVCELAMARGGDSVARQRVAVADAIRPAFPSSSGNLNRELSRLLCYLEDASVIEPLLSMMAADDGERRALGAGYFSRNPKYGEAIRDMLESAPLLDRMHFAQMLLWLPDGWESGQRRRYFQLIADATAHSKGGYWYQEFWRRIRDVALDQAPEDEREQYASIAAEVVEAGEQEALPAPEGPGRVWTVETAAELLESGLQGRNFENGQRMYAAAGCIACHRFGNEGVGVGPDLSAVGQRFTPRDILRSTINPSEAVSDQYRMVILETKDGRTFSGRIISKDADRTRIATNLMRPSQSVALDNSEIVREEAAPVSTMPSGLLNRLNEDEVLDLMAYLISGGDAESPLFREEE